MKIFYSWQLDTPSKCGKTLVRDALDAAVSKLSETLNLDEAERPTVDQDTAGVLGSPSITDTIFKKICDANVIVADVTLTGGTPDGKRLINSNVAIELGYTLGIHGDHVLLKVMNTHYGPPEHLPFDLRHKRWPVRFDLAPEATATDRRKTRDTLSDELQEIIKSYFESSRPRPDPFSPTHSTHNAAAYWRDGETLATLDAMPLRGRPEMALGYRATEPLIYLRLWPSEKIEPLTVQQLGDYRHSSIEPLCGRTGGWSWYRNRFGTLAYATDGANRLASSTQVFKSGEIWGVHARFLRREAEERENFPDYIPTQAYEQGMRESLKRYLDVATQHFGYPPVIHVAAGLVNVNGFKLAMSNHDFWGPIFDDVGVVTTVDVESPSTTIDALLKIFDATYESAGHQRPQGLYGFPHKL